MLYQLFRRIIKFLRKNYYKVYVLFSSFFKPLNFKTKGRFSCHQLVRLEGKGRIIFGDKVMIGVSPSPYLYETSSYIEARSEASDIYIGDNVCINNNAAIIAGGSSIHIGKDCLIGPNFVCFDSNFHSLKPSRRENSNYSYKSVFIDENVFIGANVTVLKGSYIGRNSVIGAGCVINGIIPEGSLVSLHDNYKIDKLRVDS